MQKRIFILFALVALVMGGITHLANAQMIEIDFDTYSEGELLGQTQSGLEWMDGGAEDNPPTSFVVQNGELTLIPEEVRGQWIYLQFENQTGPITVTWDWQYVGDPTGDVDVGLCISDADNFSLGDNPAMTWPEQGAMARMSEQIDDQTAILDARDGDLAGGGDYLAWEEVIYNDGALIHMRMEIDTENETFSAWAQKEGEEEAQIANEYLFRRGIVDGLDSLTLWQNANVEDPENVALIEAGEELPRVIIDNIVIEGDFPTTTVKHWSLH